METKNPALTEAHIERRIRQTEQLAADAERHVERLSTELSGLVQRHSYFVRQLKRNVLLLQTANELRQTQKIKWIKEALDGASTAERNARADLQAAYARYFASI